MKQDLPIIHFCDNDLDGLSCCWALDSFFLNTNHFPIYSKSNFFKTVSRKLKKMDASVLTLVIISDIPLSQSDCINLEEIVKNHSSNFSILLFDHHSTNSSSQNVFPWYNHDVTECSSSLLFKFFTKQSKENSGHSELIEIVKSYDLWEDTELQRNKGVFLSNTIFKRYGQIFPQFAREKEHAFQLFLLNELSKLLITENVLTCEFELPKIIYKYLSSLEIQQTSTDISFSYLIFESLLNDFYKSPLEKIRIDNHSGVVLSNFSAEQFQFFGHKLLDRSPNLDFVILLTDTGRVSLRSTSVACDVSKIVKAHFNSSHSGGHCNAAGGMFSKKSMENLLQMYRR